MPHSCLGGLARWSLDLGPTLAIEWLPAVTLANEIGFNAESVNDHHLALVHALGALSGVMLSTGKTYTEADSTNLSIFAVVTVVHLLLTYFRPLSPLVLTTEIMA